MNIYFEIVNFYIQSLCTGCLYINFELCYKYYNLLKFHNNIIQKKNKNKIKYFSYEPNFVIRYQINEIVDNFLKYDSDFQLSVNQLL